MSDRDTFVFGPFRLSAGRRELSAHGTPVQLGPRAFDLLLALVRRHGLVSTKDELMAEVWPGTVVEENNLQVQVSAIRKVLGEEPEGNRYLLTVPGRGYRFVAQVERINGADDAQSQPVSTGRGGEPLPLPDKPSIAVLPFTNMSGEPEQEYFADGMAEDIITALSRCSSIFVIARNSSFTYKGRVVDIREVGRELGVRYVLEGSVRRGGERLRFTAQLIDAASGSHIWADRFDGEMSDIFDLQDRITGNVVAAIEPTIQAVEIERLKHKTAANLTAYDHLLRAQQFEYECTEESIEAALNHLKQAIGIEPNYAPAMALAAFCYGWRRTQGWTKDVAAEKTEGLRLVSRALELGRFDANVLWMCAFAAWELGQDGKRVLELAYRSLETNPNSAIALTVAGRTEVLSGHYAKGKELLERALRLSPRDPRAWYVAQGLAIAGLGEGQFEDGAAWAHKALAQNPRFAGAIRMLAANLAFLGQVDAAREAVADNLRIEPGLTISKLHARRIYMHESLWEKFSEGLRLAGLPE
jgi:TolB-like protein/Tfp pilus assembly protein PilF